MHAGFLRYRYDSPYGSLYGVQPTQNVVDGRIGLRVDLDMFQLEIAWVGVSNHTAAYLITGSEQPQRRRRGAVLLLLDASALRPARRADQLALFGADSGFGGIERNASRACESREMTVATGMWSRAAMSA